ncbi:MarR family winged helix-turn-helix transcriptional regulator [Cohnella luojiensis]|uniref:HTH-type transcriptional regulator MgrA n=1 Tax=Cohnella luojiensis TaxID=652876 RepID=A0A4Y8M508_9BACL|nr:winged helix DNA-binding protein [Cohnella luojiensis]TFE27485.1 MarR family transcriptional regulator [Cohnella luojiensis]
MKQEKKLPHNELLEVEFGAEKQFPISFSIFALARSHRALASQLIRETGLFPGQEIILMQLFQQDGQSQNSLGRTLRLDHSTIAKSVRRLEEAGLITRNRSDEDGRVTIVSLTEAGRGFESKVLEAWSILERITIENLSEQEKERLINLSRKVAAQVDTALK